MSFNRRMDAAGPGRRVGEGGSDSSQGGFEWHLNTIKIKIMAFFKKVKKAINGKWYPQGVALGGPVGTREIADRLSEMSTLTPGDVYAVLANLGQVMSDYMAVGNTVKLDGVGTFFYTPRMKGQGVDTCEEVSAEQITGVSVRFIPETRRSAGNNVVGRPLVADKVEWVDMDKLGGRKRSRSDRM